MSEKVCFQVARTPLFEDAVVDDETETEIPQTSAV